MITGCYFCGRPFDDEDALLHVAEHDEEAVAGLERTPAPPRADDLDLAPLSGLGADLAGEQGQGRRLAEAPLGARSVGASALIPGRLDIVPPAVDPQSGVRVRLFRGARVVPPRLARRLAQPF